MGFWEAFFNARFFFALCFVAVLQPLVILGLDRLERKTQHVAVTRGILAYAGRPFVYALLVVLFMLLAYPALFGFDEAPSLPDILAANGKSATNLINWVFLLGLFLPAVPILGRHKGTVNALQIVITGALVGTWLTEAHVRHSALRLMPPVALAFQLVLMTVAFDRLSELFGAVLGKRLDRYCHIEGSGFLLEPMIGFFLQGPVILLYLLFLGMQIAR